MHWGRKIDACESIEHSHENQKLFSEKFDKNDVEWWFRNGQEKFVSRSTVTSIIEKCQKIMKIDEE